MGPNRTDKPQSGPFETCAAGPVMVLPPAARDGTLGRGPDQLHVRPAACDKLEAVGVPQALRAPPPSTPQRK